MANYTKEHSTGWKPVAIDCKTHELLVKVVNEINARNMRTPEGFPVRISLKDAVKYAIEKVAKDFKITK